MSRSFKDVANAPMFRNMRTTRSLRVLTAKDEELLGYGIRPIGKYSLPNAWDDITCHASKKGRLYTFNKNKGM